MPAYELLLISKCDCVDRFQLIFFQIKHKLLKTLGVNTVITYFFFLSSNNDKTIKVESQNYVYKRERFCYNDEIMFSEKMQTPTAIDKSIYNFGYKSTVLRIFLFFFYIHIFTNQFQYFFLKN